MPPWGMNYAAQKRLCSGIRAMQPRELDGPWTLTELASSEAFGQ